ncbi:Uu.00g042200.m01.CDS01 [Anthostomella pinea]|uniref:Uu.00g042200.m01.CDS01 n=1 Tax=Anthostomella pinea TaxID=933095 RepID=A0AAI8VB21_9PEZI|nr:Uu.00g042200.m01.CDS01 [Anthostomella pinea]
MSSSQSQKPQAPRYESNKYCVCTSCINNDGGQCATLVELEKHLKTVGILTANDAQLTQILLPGPPTHDLTPCHTTLLAFFSGVMDRELRDNMSKGRSMSRIQFFNQKICADDMASLLTWCRTGRIHIDYDDSDFQDDRCRFERLWNLAAMLEMPEFANFCMRLILAKYSWNVLGASETPALDFQSAPYGPTGPLFVITNQLDVVRHSRLSAFIERLLTSRDPLQEDLVHAVSNGKREAYQNAWHDRLASNIQLNYRVAESRTVDESKVDNDPTNPELAGLFLVSVPDRDPDQFRLELSRQGYQTAKNTVAKTKYTQRTLCVPSRDKQVFYKAFEYDPADHRELGAAPPR